MKNLIKKKSILQWQSRWDKCPTGRWTHQLIPTVVTNKNKETVCRKSEVDFNRLVLGCARLNDHLNKILPLAQNTPQCDCGNDRETIQHFMLHCPRHTEARQKMVEEIEHIFASQKVPTYLRNITIQELLGQKNEYNSSVKKKIHCSVLSFLKTTNRKL